MLAAVTIEFLEYLFKVVQFSVGYVDAVVLQTVFPMSEVGQFMVTQFFKAVNIWVRKFLFLFQKFAQFLTLSTIEVV